MASSRRACLQTAVALRLRNSAQGEVVEDCMAHRAESLPAARFLCIADADIDAEDHPARDPQNGQ